MKVYYGFSYITPKAIRKAELAIYFENCDHWKNEAWIAKRMKIVYVRRQTTGEIEDGKNKNRSFTKFSLFIDEKPFYSDIDKVLDLNFEADKNNVPQIERDLIKQKLRDAYFEHFNRKDRGNYQLSLF